MSEETLFISDCHLDASRPQVVQELIHFLNQRAASAARLYILGDLFEVWLGDDDQAEDLAPVLEALKRRAETTKTYFIAGNRDFLLGFSFARQHGIELVCEPEVLQFGDERVVLIHGDTLCTDDHDYQAFRNLVRNPDWQAEFLEKPLTERRLIAAGLRKDSAQAMLDKAAEIMDVNDDAVNQCFREHRVDTIIHGHTHRPAIHRYDSKLTRYVLGDWIPQASYLSWNTVRGFKLFDSRI